ncbi:DNA-binding response regulator [Nitrobacter sp. Nb-311A]|uniref:response regulator transcription factor n=1 Tax=Nitrobacter sp. Nb-311A TaxID=314253 RepID=UPI0000684A0F|nr:MULTISPECIES: response regulator transcription factor [unclassified Nitrobacter]EAQ35335.1 DNA-binding response regulator [Nitrobacter sp. Nb-311A]MCV0387502.1 response regulator transcription factor [Nitrobacter sp.]
MRLLLIEDDAMFGKALVRGLGQNGMTVDWIRDGSDGLAALTRAEHAAALLDIGLPEMSGFEILKAMRSSRRMPPILIITARDHVEDIVAGLDLGADDYLIKPFDLRTLLARIRAVVRRTNARTSALMTSKDIALNPSTYVATFRDVEATLSAREFSVLYALMEHPGTILSRSQIEMRIYGWGEEIQSNAVDVVIHGLRKKFGKDMIHNIRGAGWVVIKGES